MRPFSAREIVREILVRTVNELAREGFVAAVTGDSVSVDRTKRPEHGDFASNVALTLAKPAGKQPRAVAEAIVARLPLGGKSPLSEATVAGPGFINVRLAPAFWQDSARRDAGGRRRLGAGVAASVAEGSARVPVVEPDRDRSRWPTAGSPPSAMR